jgi:flavin reductase (DIM6/NTAB) family NADH-FMN oxidoreductase RutF
MSAPPEDAVRALGRVPSGLFIVTAGHGDTEAAMLASWVQQCAFEPPQVAMAVRAGRPVLALLAAGAPFAVNVLAEGQHDLVKHFGKGFDPGQRPFEGLTVERPEGGAPALPGALAHIQCRVTARMAVGDHELVVGRVVGGRVHAEGRPTVHVRKSGLHY